MHRIAATPGGWNPDAEGVIIVEQSPAPIVVLTAADTDIQTLAAAQGKLPDDFPEIRVVNLLQLQQPLSIDGYAEDVLIHAKVIILRLLGGKAYWSYGLEVVKETVSQTGAALWVIPGDDRPDPDMVSHSTVSLGAVNRLWRYFIEGGVGNFVHGLQFVADVGLGCEFNPPSAEVVPRVGRYPYPIVETRNGASLRFANASLPNRGYLPKVGIIFYRAHYLAGNTQPINGICQELVSKNLQPVPIFVSSLGDAEVQVEVIECLDNVEVILNTTSFSVGKIGNEDSQLWRRLDVPILQVILSGGTVEQWEDSFAGLTPRDVAMNVALPEVDGKIITRAVSFKAVQTWDQKLETDVVVYEAKRDRVQYITNLAESWVRLRRTPLSERKIALVLANYPNKDGRIANGVGLDTPASCIEILKALQQAGYRVGDIPGDGDKLIELLTTGITNDSEGEGLRQVRQSLSLEAYQDYFASLPEKVQAEITNRWGDTPKLFQNEIAISGMQLGNIFVGIQPSRGYDLDPSLNYHAPDLEPTHNYLAFYHWLRQEFYTLAIVHIGKHGNLEWLPGKSLALSQNCYPEVAFGKLPHFYPFIVNDPGEGSQAKRRSQAVILDHLTPPMTRAELYGSLQQLEGLIDEYYSAQSLDPSRLSVVRDRVVDLVTQENLHQELGIETLDDNSIMQFLTLADGYLCELKEAQIRDGLHIFGKCPQATQLRDLIISIARSPDVNRMGITCALAKDLNLVEMQNFASPNSASIDIGNIDSQTLDQIWLGGDKELLSQPIQEIDIAELQQKGISDTCCQHFSQCHTVGDAIEALENLAAEWVDKLLQHYFETAYQTSQSLDNPLPSPSYSQKSDQKIPDTPLHSFLKTNTDSPSNNSYPSTPITEIASLTPQPWGKPVDNFSDSVNTEVNETDTNLENPPELGDLGGEFPNTQKELTWIQNQLLPRLLRTSDEITNLIHGLNGHYIPSGASGAPTRGRADVLPTGRNFYAVDIRGIPTETAWSIGKKAAEAVIERYTQENGEYPRTLALSVWGTSTMRTGGDDIAQALGLLGVQPVWDGISRRVVDFEILPVSVLGRPRVDVTLRISGFFRDSFPNITNLLYDAIAQVSTLDEPPEINPLATQVKQDSEYWRKAGLNEEEAGNRALHRIFGSKPGAYGAGLQGLIEAQNWTTDEDLARAYINWSSYAYVPHNGGIKGVSSPEAFTQRLQDLQIVLHNQDNREHDLLDSDDYYQFQGGLTAAVRSIQGKNPKTYFGDNSIPSRPLVKALSEEIAKVYRSRVVNPKWIEGVMRHGYKGAFEMAATVDYLFAYDATAQCVEDYMYQGVAEAYLFDEKVQQFIQDKNPWALRDMAERLLEAQQRGMWDSGENVKEELRAIALQAEGKIETGVDGS
jgi:cobaltochelatase CobN